MERLEGGFRQQSAVPMEFQCRRKDGRVFMASIYISPVRDADGLIVQHFASLVDCTAHYEQKLMLDRLMSLQAELIHLARTSAMGTMATSLGHELNQPLAAISNYAAGCRLRLGTRPLDIAGLAIDLKHIEDSALRAGGIISGLRALTRGGGGKRGLFDLAEAVNECIELVLAGASDGVAIEGLNDGAAMIDADRVQIQQVVINLLKNGCEAAAGSPGGRVMVTTGHDHDQATVSVDDTGPPLSPAVAARLFEWDHSTKPEGMGVGLSISRTIIENHEGTIRFEPREDGHTRFTFSLPAAEPEPQSP
jgi:two-component system sensor kinase FixL